MRAIIVGGGKVGYYLLKTLMNKKYDITLVEKDSEVCEKIASEVEGDIICGDGTDFDVLKDAGIEDAEMVAAVTGKDEENLVICQIAKNSFNVKKTISRINNPKNRLIFKSLGVDKTVCSTEVIANLIEWQLAEDRLKVIQTLDRGEMVLAEGIVNPSSPCCGKIISSLHLPIECIIVSIIRGDRAIFPKGGVEIKDGDRLMIMTAVESKKAVERCILGE